MAPQTMYNIWPLNTQKELFYILHVVFSLFAFTLKEGIGIFSSKKRSKQQGQQGWSGRLML